jgi:histidine triad (HIT) family protein
MQASREVMTECIFCAIAAGQAPCHGIWEDEKHLAFLSIFPNTKGFSVVITKRHYPSYAFDLPEDVLTGLVLAAKRVGRLLDDRLEDVGRTGLILEGFAVDHAHAKLFPMHGTRMPQWRPLSRPADKYFARYEGYISSHDYRRANDADLAALARRLRR